jgi:hypothetical protein
MPGVASRAAAPALRGRVASVACLLVAACSTYDASLLQAKRARPDASIDGGHVDVDAGNPSTECIGSGALMCARPNADATCVAATCLIVRCREPYLDCDGLPENGCEATLDAPEHCGACRASCRRAHVAHARCDPGGEGGPCFIDHSCPLGAVDCIAGEPRNGCETGFADCDGIPSNGCETSLRTLTDCGGCAQACTSVDSEVSCETGACVKLGCSPGFGDCRGQGCESLVADPEHCGECGTACSEGASMCHGGRCTGATCASGTADCDGDTENGCETSLADVASCGFCDLGCGPYPHAQRGCSDGACTITGCDDGFANCDGVRDNGCEVDLGDPVTCGSCGNDCSALQNVASAACSDDQCSDLVCEDGWGDCDGSPANGCEQSLSSAAHCGACEKPCQLANATSSCSGGSCAISACSGQFDDCNGQAGDGCEASLDTEAHCGSCGSACGEGTICEAGGCGCGAGVGCADGAECCGNACVNTRSDCFPWPCIPGTRADKANCGGCGVDCPFYCCLIP